MKKIKIHQHHLTEFLDCPMKFHLAENLCFIPRISKKYLDLGTAYHIGVASWKKTFDKELAMINVLNYFDNIKPENQEEQNEFDRIYVIAQAMLMGYFDKYKEKDVSLETKYISVEKKLICLFENIQLIAIPDATYYNNGYWLQEDKTTSRLGEDYITRLPLDFQVTFYFYVAQKSLHRKFEGIDYRITKVPTIRLKKNQSKEQYMNELALQYKNYSEDYYINEKLYRSEDDLKTFEKELNWQVKDLINCYKTNHWYRKTTICKKINCWFEKYCVNMTEETLNTFYKKREDISKCFSIINNY